MMEQYDTRIDAYIEKSADFAKPILKHLRELVHRASPEIMETIKWSAPFFEYNGILCHMMAFKQHLGFGFWKADTLPDPHQILHLEGGEAAGSLGRISSLADLPDDDILIWYIRQAMLLKGAPNAKPKAQPAKPATASATATLTTPDYLTELLAQTPAAKEYFDKFSQSQKKEYITWFEDAKSEATREKRLKEGLEWISEGKTRHWKYK
ncbi:YdeI/OmpD-associated family protein [Mucilaginibacter sp.]|uniref:YdeI/OmpD-associated family protein n=1 Tax=Mucilaginibacter sp. TaxID=1882438 RepID=UPI003264AA9C